MAQVLLLSIGSSGDVYPFIGLGVALQKRGHTATLIANEHFRELAARESLGFTAMGTTEQYVEAVNHPAAWDRRRGSQTLAPFALRAMREGFRAIESFSRKSETVLVGSRYSFATLLAKERLDLPAITLLLNLPSLRSIYSPPCIPSLPFLPHLRPTGARIAFRMIDRKYDRLFVDPINCFRAELRMAPIQRLYDWWNSADLLIASWPEWLYGPQPDWPRNAICSGFIDYDGASTVAADSRGEAALANPAERPLVFTAGTPVTQARDFFQAAVRVCLAMKRSGVLLSQYREQIPDNLPACVQHVHYAPLSALLPQASAIVHTGGIGTAARAVKSGIPQLIVPMCHDQFENGQRFARLGVAKCLSSRKTSAAVMVRLLNELLSSQTVAGRCRCWAAELQRTAALPRICSLIENFCTRRNKHFPSLLGVRRSFASNRFLEGGFHDELAR